MIYIVIPVYNEEENILKLAEELQKNEVKGKIKYVFSDDGSIDNTINLIREYFSKLDFIILGDGNNYGPGNAFNLAFEWVIEDSKNNEDVIVTMEADCTSDLAILNDMLIINQLGYDLVLASVYAQGGGFDKTNFSRKFISSIANLLFRFLFNIKVQTISSFYRVYSLKLLVSIKNKHSTLITEKGFICMLEILIKSISCKAKVIEVPMILYSNKRIGKSKMKVFKNSIQYIQFLIKNKSFK
jgi:dolichol-phosphate mannosyltransferase